MHRTPTPPAPAGRPNTAVPEDSASRPADPASRREYPCCSERQMRRRNAQRPCVRLTDDIAGLPEEVLQYLADTSIRDTLDILGLRPLDRALAEMRLSGLTVRQIALSTGLKKWRVEKALIALRHRLEAARRSGLSHPADGWQDVYLSETRRRGR